MAVKHIGLFAGLFLLGGISAMLLADSQTPKEAVIPSPAAPITAAPKVEVPTRYTFVRQIGKSAPRGRDVSRIAVDAHGLLYGLDGGEVVVWQDNGRVLRRFGQWDRDHVSKERLQNPQTLTLDNQGNVFVADGYEEGGAFGSRIVQYTTAGRFVRTFDAGKAPHPLKYAPEEMRGIAYPLSN